MTANREPSNQSFELDREATVCSASRRFFFAIDRYNRSLTYTQRKVRPVSMIGKAEGPSGRAKIHSDDPKQALGLAQYLRTIGYNAWIEDTNGNEIDEKALKMATRSHHEDAPSS
jgi:hypothetical protein